MQDSKRAPRRPHSAEVESRVLVECAKPGASVAQVALPNGLNANLVPKWRRQSGHGRTAVQPQLASGTFISLTLAPEPTPADADIRLELRRGPVAMSVSWPVAAAAHCAAWVREVLK